MRHSSVFKQNWEFGITLLKKYKEVLVITQYLLQGVWSELSHAHDDCITLPAAAEPPCSVVLGLSRADRSWLVLGLQSPCEECTMGDGADC